MYLIYTYFYSQQRQLQEKPNHHWLSIYISTQFKKSTAECISKYNSLHHVGQKLAQHVKQVFNATLVNQFSYN